MKRRIYDILLVSKEKGDLSWLFDMFIITLILLNVVAIVLESVASIRNQFGEFFKLFELFSVIVFTAEYILRVWTANLNPKYSQTFLGNFKFALTPMAIIDLLAILPFYLPYIGVDLRLLRILRIFRIFRLFKIVRYVSALALINQVLKQKREELVVTFIFTMFLLLLSSTLMYYVEHDAQPDHF